MNVSSVSHSYSLVHIQIVETCTSQRKVKRKVLCLAFLFLDYARAQATGLHCAVYDGLYGTV